MALLNTKKLFFFALFLYGINLWSSTSDIYNVELKSINETFSFELAGQKDWNYDLKKSSDAKNFKIILTLNGFDQGKLNKIKKINNKFVKEINILPTRVKELTEIEFVLENKNVQSFDYLTDYPSKLIIDFYVNETKASLSQPDLVVSKENRQAKIEKKSEKNKNKLETEKTRKPSNVDFFYIDKDNNGEVSNINLNDSFLTGSNDKLERFQLKSFEQKNMQKNVLENYFVNYPVLEQPFSFWEKIKKNSPEYVIEKNSSDENLKVRLIQTLFKKQRPLVLKKTVEWFESKYPNSKYLDVIFGMTADLFLSKFKETNNEKDYEVAQKYYTKILEQTPNSILYERTSLVSAFNEIDQNKYLLGLRKLNAHLENKRFLENNSLYYARLGIAHCLAKLGKIDQALKELDFIANSPATDQIKTEALYKKGDYLTASERYNEAIATYVNTQNLYPNEKLNFPNAYFNKMESEFQVKKVADAHSSAINFIKYFESHDYAPYALTRLGELLEHMGAEQSKAVGAYLETHFKYGDSPKTIVARLHLMGLRMKGMKEVEVNQTISKMNELAAKSDLENIQQFKNIMIGDGFIRRKEYEKAIQVLTSQIQDSPQKKGSNQITDRVRNYIKEYISHLSEQNKPVEVLKNYKKYADNWLREQESAATFYEIGKAYQDLGVYDLALKKYDQSYKKANSSTAITDFDSERTNLQKHKQKIYLQTAYSLFQAKEYKKAEVALNQIEKPYVMNDEEQIQRVSLVADIFEKKEDFVTATRYLSELIKVWKDKPELVIDASIKNAYLLSKLNQAEKGVNQLNELIDEKTPTSSLIKIYKAQAEIALQNKLNLIAISVIEKLLKTDVNPQSQSRYQLGQLYFEQGEVKQAQQVWSNFSETDDQFWSKLAQNKMKSKQWNQDYKKYISRLPAATGVK